MDYDSMSKAELIKEIQELRHQNKELKFYKHILDQLPVCTIFYDDSEKVVYRNKASKLIDGYSDNELLGITRHEYLESLQVKPGKTINKVIKPVSSTGSFEKGLFGISETSLKMKNGATKPVLLIGSFAYDESKNLIGACGCAIDLTEYDKKERMYQLLVETIPIPVFLKDASGLYQDCNAAFENFWGLPKEKIIGNSVDIWPKEAADKFRQMDNQLYQKPGTQVYEIQLTHADKTQRDIIFNKATYAITKDSKVDGLVGVMTDITERRYMEKEMARLERLNLIGEMAASIGHEVRNPMTTVRGFLQILKDKAECSAYKDFFKLMIEELDRANSIISQYLSLAKDRPFDKRIDDLNSIIKTLYPLIQAEFHEANKNIHLDLNDIPSIVLDEREMRQLILNLVRNGLEAMSPNGCMTIGTFVEDDQVVLYVKDDGIGIEPAVIEKIGTPFITTKENGTGLGLAVCYSIAARHNAKIEVKSSASGTTFYVRFNAFYYDSK